MGQNYGILSPPTLNRAIYNVLQTITTSYSLKNLSFFVLETNFVN